MTFKSTLNPTFRTSFAEDIFKHKYAHEGAETWGELCRTLVLDVCGGQMSRDDMDTLIKLMYELKFIPGGRYLYYAGRRNKFFNNCYILKSEEDTREDWAELSKKAELCLSTGGGIGNDYSIYRASGTKLSGTGGVASGPLAKMLQINETGRCIMQGGSRRSAIYASLNHKHGDIDAFMHMKDWYNMQVAGTGGKSVGDLKEADFNYHAPMDMTNISVNYDTAWLKNYWETGDYGTTFYKNVEQALKTGEPGFSFNFFDKETETGRNAPVSADTWVLALGGYIQIKDTLGAPVKVWTGKQWAKTEFKKTKSDVETVTVRMSGGREIKADPTHEFLVEKWHGAGKRRKLKAIDRIAASALEKNDILHVSYPVDALIEDRDNEAYWYGYAYGDGSFRGCKADITFCTEAAKECARVADVEAMSTSVNPCESRGYMRAYLKSPFFVGRAKDVYPYGEFSPSIVVSFIAGLFDSDGCYSADRDLIRFSSKHMSFLEGVRRELEGLGIMSGISSGGISTYGGTETYSLSVYKDYTGLFAELIPTIRLKIHSTPSYRKSTIRVLGVENGPTEDVYCCDVKVKEHSFMAEGVIISNCGEIVSSNDSDVCNLGSVNFAAIKDFKELLTVIELGTKFLMLGTIKADVPYDKVALIRTKNRRLGLGLMGLHEWLLQRGHNYEVVPELHRWLTAYEAISNGVSTDFADSLSISRPVACRAIAPTGSIGILAGTTTGIEPIFATAYKRRYLKGKRWHYQYVVDSTAQHMVENLGVDPNNIETALDLANDYERRIKFQADVQDYVDMSISSTINLPRYGTSNNNSDSVRAFADTLASYAHRLRGFTCYPDCSRGGQPLVSIPYAEAHERLGEEFQEHVETIDICDITGKGGSCGS